MRFLNEIKVGIVVLAGVALIIFGYFSLRGVGLGAEIYYLKLDGAAAIAQGNDVRLQGVKIGQVQEVGFDTTDQKPLLTLAVRRSDPPFRLLKTYTYSVQSAGIVGENYVDIRGPYTPSAPVYAKNTPSQIIPGEASSGLLGVTNNAEAIAEDLRETIRSFNVTLERINNGVLNVQNQRKLAETLDGLAKLTENASQSFGPEGVKVGFGDSRVQNDLRRAMANVEQASRIAAQASRNIERASQNAYLASEDGRGILRDLRGETRGVVRGLVDENRGQIRSLLGSVNSSAKNIAGITETLDFALKQGGFKENSQLAFQSLRRAAENVEVATSGLRKLGEDPENTNALKATLVALRDSTDALKLTAQSIRDGLGSGETGRFNQILNNLNGVTKNLEGTTAGLQNIIGDPKTQGDIKGAVSNLNETLAATRSAAQRINGLLGGRNPRRNRETTDEKTGGTSSNPQDATTKTENDANAFTDSQGISFTYRYLRDGAPRRSDRNFGDFQYDGEFGGNPLRLGLANIGDGSDVTAQSGSFLSDNLALRYGLYRSKLGVGAEFRKGKFSLEGNAWAPNDRAYNLYGGYQITDNLEILAGREEIGGRGSSALGLRFRQ